MVGQTMGLPTAMTLYSFIGVVVTSASALLFGEAIRDPVVLIGRFNQPVVALVALVAILLATLNTNVAANDNVRPKVQKIVGGRHQSSGLHRRHALRIPQIGSIRQGHSRTTAS
jgi:hypothetical protein